MGYGNSSGVGPHFHLKNFRCFLEKLAPVQGLPPPSRGRAHGYQAKRMLFFFGSYGWCQSKATRPKGPQVGDQHEGRE